MKLAMSSDQMKPILRMFRTEEQKALKTDPMNNEGGSWLIPSQKGLTGMLEPVHHCGLDAFVWLNPTSLSCKETNTQKSHGGMCGCNSFQQSEHSCPTWCGPHRDGYCCTRRWCFLLMAVSKSQRFPQQHWALMVKLQIRVRWSSQILSGVMVPAKSPWSSL